MLKRILSLVLNSKQQSKPLVKTTTVESKDDSPWIDCGGDPNDWMTGMIMDAKKRKAKQIDDYIFEEYEE
tara:strand:+ start:335 stop:544 length:210 start_codon:yes stop_codon:yes gene_type:complete